MPPTPAALHIRTYRPEDHGAVTALNRYGLAAAGVPEDADVYAGDLDDVSANYLTGRATLLVGEVDDTVVAMGALAPIDGTTCEVVRMRVMPSHQGRGYGRAILDALEQAAVGMGYRRAVLLTGPQQRPAIDLYQSAGYSVTGTEQHGSLAGVRMAKQLI